MKGYKMLNYTNPKLFKTILHEVVEELKMAYPHNVNRFQLEQLLMN